jgi:hypothetical protein
MSVPKIVIVYTETPGGPRLDIHGSHQFELVINDPRGVSAYGVVCPTEEGEKILRDHAQYFEDHAARVAAE